MRAVHPAATLERLRRGPLSRAPPLARHREPSHGRARGTGAARRGNRSGGRPSRPTTEGRTGADRSRDRRDRARRARRARRRARARTGARDHRPDRRADRRLPTGARRVRAPRQRPARRGDGRGRQPRRLAALSSYLNDARRAIHERLDLVNDSLSRVPFNRDGERETFLVIEPSDRHLPDVVAFRQSLRAFLENAYTRDAALAERRFVELESLVDRLASEETADRRWRALVLDVRVHVDFMGRELDAEGVQVEVYRSGAGKSGGQRQKLATTCLAAALRYQLGGGDRAAPVYSSVVLDEAFDKADDEFTDLAMRIFGEFGFQMIVATPMKSVMTLEPHIGGACFVDIRDRRRSSTLAIACDGEARRLRLGDVTART